jgi:hypothetical protein
MFAVVEIIAPVAALWDERRHGGIDEDRLHATLRPVATILGLFAFLDHRCRTEPGTVPEVVYRYRVATTGGDHSRVRASFRYPSSSGGPWPGRAYSNP